jgi:hypothetical protein
VEQVDRLRNWATELRTFAVAISTLEGSLGHRERIQGDIFGSAEFHSDLVDLKKAIDARPDQSALSAAESWLVIAQERWEKRRQTQAKLAKSKATAVTGGAVYKHYCAASDEALTSLYSDVEKEFSEFYREINSDDESAFKASLEPSAGKLDLSVDFYGLGMFPPGAYHSEGHQDGMGVCLYLSLVKQLLGSDFRFAVLDDVVMSIDSNHRRQFCNLLKNRFPDVQFIITTHDEVWARQMKSSGLVSKASQAHFHGWTVDGGPVLDSGSDFWDKVEEHLSNADVPAAAACLRRSLESTMSDLASSLRGSVPYRQESNHDLGELLSSVKGAHSKWLKAASNSANSWNNEADKTRVDALKDKRSVAVLAHENEGWAVNSVVHYNEWANLNEADFRPVVDACKEFVALFSCSNDACQSFIAVSGAPGHEESLRCGCGTYNLNLTLKPKG